MIGARSVTTKIGGVVGDAGLTDRLSHVEGDQVARFRGRVTVGGR